MAEEKQEKEKRKQEEKKVNAAEVDKEQDVSPEMLRAMELAAARLEQANKIYELNKKAEEAKKINEMLDGEGEAGVEKKEETPKEYKDRILRGEIE